jgi:hypothetical protein
MIDKRPYKNIGKWTGSFESEVPDKNSWSVAPNTKNKVGQTAYNQYFYSGQDVYVFIYPYYGKKLVPIPVTAFAFGISQEKIPIYGAWSYKFDAVARGTRLIRGEFSVVYTEPNFIGSLIGAQNSRYNYPDYPTEASLLGDLIIENDPDSEEARKADLKANIWNVVNGKKSGEDPISLFKGNDSSRSEAYPFGRSAPEGANEADYAGHPPFDIIISMGNNPNQRFIDNQHFSYETWAYSCQDYVKMVSEDINDKGWATSNRVHIETIELMSAATQYDLSGQPLQETYAFIARDATTPSIR